MVDIAQLQVSIETKGIDKAGRQLDQLGTKGDRVESGFDRSSNAAKRFGDAGERGGKRAGRGVDAVGRSVQNVNKLLRIAAPAIAGLASGKSIAAGFKAYEDFQLALAGVAKNSDLSNQELNEFEKTVRGISKSTGAVTNDLLRFSASAAQVGVQGQENLAKVGQIALQLEKSTSLLGEDAIRDFARVLNLTQEGASGENFEKLSSQVVALGNNFAATESEITKFTIETAKGIARFGVASDDLAALSASMAALGLQPESARTAISKLFETIDQGVRRGGGQLDQLAQVAGVSATDFKKAYAEDAFGAFSLFLKGLGEAGKAGQDQGKILDDLKLKGVETRASILPLANAFSGSSGLDEALKISSSEAEKFKNGQGALATEVGKSTSLIQSARSRLTAAFSDKQIQFADQYKDEFVEIINAVTDFVNDPAFDSVVTVLGKVVGGAAEITKVLTQAFISNFDKFVSALSAFASIKITQKGFAVFNALKTNFESAQAQFKAFKDGLANVDAQSFNEKMQSTTRATGLLTGGLGRAKNAAIAFGGVLAANPAFLIGAGIFALTQYLQRNAEAQRALQETVDKGNQTLNDYGITVDNVASKFRQLTEAQQSQVIFEQTQSLAAAGEQIKSIAGGLDTFLNQGFGSGSEGIQRLQEELSAFTNGGLEAKDLLQSFYDLVNSGQKLELGTVFNREVDLASLEGELKKLAEVESQIQQSQTILDQARSSTASLVQSQSDIVSATAKQASDALSEAKTQQDSIIAAQEQAIEKANAITAATDRVADAQSSAAVDLQSDVSAIKDQVDLLQNALASVSSAQADLASQSIDVSQIEASISMIKSQTEGLSPAVANSMTEVVSSVVGGIQSAEAKLKTSWETLGSALGGTLVSGVTKGISSLSNSVSSALDAAEKATIRDWSKHGKALMATLASGVKSGSGSLYSAVKNAVADARKLLPSSDAKEGPFSKLTAYGFSIPDTMAKGVLSNKTLKQSVETAAKRALDAAKQAQDKILSLRAQNENSRELSVAISRGDDTDLLKIAQDARALDEQLQKSGLKAQETAAKAKEYAVALRNRLSLEREIAGTGLIETTLEQERERLDLAKQLNSLRENGASKEQVAIAEKTLSFQNRLVKTAGLNREQIQKARDEYAQILTQQANLDRLEQARLDKVKQTNAALKDQSPTLKALGELFNLDKFEATKRSISDLFSNTGSRGFLGNFATNLDGVLKNFNTDFGQIAGKAAELLGDAAAKFGAGLFGGKNDETGIQAKFAQRGAGIGGSIGQAAGTALFGPIGGAIGAIGGKFLGSALGSLFGRGKARRERERRRRAELAKFFTNVDEQLAALNNSPKAAFEALVRTQNEALNKARSLRASASQLAKLEELNAKQRLAQLENLTVAQLESMRSILTEAEFQQAIIGAEFNQVTDLVKQRIQEERNLAQTMRQSAQSLADFRQSLDFSEFSTLKPVQQLELARAEFERISKAARLGDVTAIAGFQDAANQLLKLSRQVNASSTQFANDLSNVKDQSFLIEGTASRQSEIAEKRADAAQALIDAGASEGNLALLKEFIGASGEQKLAQERASEKISKALQDGTVSNQVGFDGLAERLTALISEVRSGNELTEEQIRQAVTDRLQGQVAA